MFQILSDKLVNQMVVNGIIHEENCELYQYGVYNMIATAFHVVSILLIGAVFNMFFECLLFYACYAVLRKFAGGYHASTSLRCYFCSCLVIISVILTMKVVSADSIPILLVLFIVISGISIFVLAPVGSPNKPLDKKETVYFRKYAKIVWLLEVTVLGILWVCSWTHWSLAVSLGLAVISVALVLGRISVLGNRSVHQEAH